jgi:hypothetical protein
MAIDSTREVRRAILALLKNDATVLAILPKARIYSQAGATNPTWPFITYGSPSIVPLRASCLDGGELVVAFHGFAKQRKTGNTVAETAEDHASRLGAAIARALDGKVPTIAGGVAKIRWTGSQLLVDGGEADAFHTVQNFRIRCLTA